MNVERLIEMANDIANFFAGDPDREAGVDGVANHLRRFWEPRMRKQLLAHVAAHGPSGLNELAQAGVAKLAAMSSAAA